MPGRGNDAATTGTDKPRRHASIKARLDCSECGQPVPLDGPTRQAHCNMCQSDIPVRQGLWQAVLQEAENRHETLLGGAVHGDKIRHQGQELTYELRVTVPACEQCGAPFPAEAVTHTEELQFCCTGCGDPASTHPTPDWLQKRMPAAIQVVRTDVVVPSGGDGAVPVKTAEETPKPVVMACPQCAGSLSISVDNERLHTCEFCGADVYLPDAVWRRLHPIKKVREFFVGFAGPTPREKKQQEQARANAAQRQKKERSDQRAAEQKADLRQQSEAAKRRLLAGHAAAKPMVLLAWVAALVYAGLGVMHLSMSAAKLPASVAGPNMWRMLAVATVVAGICLGVAFIKPMQLLHQHDFVLGAKGLVSLLVPLMTLLVAFHGLRGTADFEDLHPEIPGVAPASRPFGQVMLAVNVVLGVGLVWLFQALSAARVI